MISTAEDFWRGMMEDYWDMYVLETDRPTMDGFNQWCFENNLVPDDEVYQND